MVTLSSDSRPIIGRGPPLGAGLFFLGIVSVVVMVLDHRGGYLETARMWMSAAASPIYAVVQTPYQAWSWITGSFADRSRLRTENEKLIEQLRVTRIQLLRFESLNEENRRLREIREASKGVERAHADRGDHQRLGAAVPSHGASSTRARTTACSAASPCWTRSASSAR